MQDLGGVAGRLPFLVKCDDLIRRKNKSRPPSICVSAHVSKEADTRHDGAGSVASATGE